MASENIVCCKCETNCDCAYIEPSKTKTGNDKSEIMFPVKLASEQRENSPLSILNWTLEFLMFKHQWLKNSPRGNYLVIRAVWFSVVIPAFLLICFLVLAYLVNVVQGKFILLETFSDFFTNPNPLNYLNLSGFKKIGLPFLATVSIVYWKLWHDYHSKWTYCCGLFNDILKNSDKSAVAEKLRRALAIDLLVLDLWAHRSFAEFFRDCLSEAIIHYYKENALPLEIKNINAGKLTECQALKILESYQRSDGTMILAKEKQSPSPS